MTTGRAGAVAVAAVGLLAVLSTALVALPAGAATAKDVPPKPGHWRVTRQRGGPPLSGSFTVTAKHKAVTKLRTTGGAVVNPSCGTGVVKVIGKQPIIHVSGTTFDGPYSKWIVGKRTPQDASPFGPKTVTVSQNGKTSKGNLEMSFEKATGGSDTFGEITWRHAQCQVTFGLARN